MVGSTSRCALKVQNPAYGLCTEGVTGVNSDVVMILHLNPATKTVSILSIPGTSSSPTPGPTGANKIDAALVQGPSQLVAAIEDDFGIPIQHYVELNFDSFANVVTALGGITMYFPEPVYDAYSGLNVLHHRVPPPRRGRGPPGRPGPAPAVPAARGHLDNTVDMAPGEPERPRPHRAGPRVPPGARHHGGQAGHLEPRHRPLAGERRGPAAHGGQRPLADRHGRPRAELPRRHSEPGPPADRARPGRLASALTTTRAAHTATSSSRPSRWTSRWSTSSSASPPTPTPCPARRSPNPGVGHGVGRERLGRLRPGHQDRRSPSAHSASTWWGPVTAHRWARRPRRW